MNNINDLIVENMAGGLKVREGAPSGNTNRMKWKTPEERIAACEALCKELRHGLPKNYLKIADWDTIERYMKDFPVEFPIETIEDAMRAGKSAIITTGYAGMTGKVPGFNVNAWKFIMMNMTKWTIKNDVTSDGQKLEAPILFIPEEKK